MQENEVGVAGKQVSADRRFVERMVKLFYWPAAMAMNTPGEPEDLFQDDAGPTAAVDPLDVTDIISNSVSTAKRVKSTSTRSHIAVNSAVSARPPPSVMSVYSNECSPMTPVTRTYSRKKKSSVELGVNFQDIIQDKRQKLNGPGLHLLKKPGKFTC